MRHLLPIVVLSLPLLAPLPARAQTLLIGNKGEDTEVDLSSGRMLRRIAAGTDGDGLAIVTSRRESPPAR